MVFEKRNYCSDFQLSHGIGAQTKRQKSTSFASILCVVPSNLLPSTVFCTLNAAQARHYDISAKRVNHLPQSLPIYSLICNDLFAISFYVGVVCPFSTLHCMVDVVVVAVQKDALPIPLRSCRHHELQPCAESWQ